MELFGYYRSSTSYRLRIALNLKGLEYDNVPVDLLQNQQKHASFTERNPYGSLPMLHADGRDRAQSMALIEWLDEAYPDPPFLPADIEDRYTARELAYAIATELHAPLNLPVLKYLGEELGASKQQVKQWYHHWLKRTLTPVEQRLSQLNTGDFLFNAPGLFEIVLLPQIYNTRRFEFDLAQFPHMRRIEIACLQMEAFSQAYPDHQDRNT